VFEKKRMWIFSDNLGKKLLLRPRKTYVTVEKMFILSLNRALKARIYINWEINDFNFMFDYFNYFF
jgi:uncharacterized membrane protein YGL010W